jgi:hypothetical protein
VVELPHFWLAALWFGSHTEWRSTGELTGESHSKQAHISQ